MNSLSLTHILVGMMGHCMNWGRYICRKWQLHCHNLCKSLVGHMAMDCTDLCHQLALSLVYIVGKHLR